MQSHQLFSTFSECEFLRHIDPLICLFCDDFSVCASWSMSNYCSFSRRLTTSGLWCIRLNFKGEPFWTPHPLWVGQAAEKLRHFRVDTHFIGSQDHKNRAFCISFSTVGVKPVQVADIALFEGHNIAKWNHEVLLVYFMKVTDPKRSRTCVASILTRRTNFSDSIPSNNGITSIYRRAQVKQPYDELIMSEAQSKGH